MRIEMRIEMRILRWVWYWTAWGTTALFELKSKSKACAEAGCLLGGKGWSLASWTPVGRQLDVVPVRWDWNSMGLKQHSLKLVGI